MRFLRFLHSKESTNQYVLYFHFQLLLIYKTRFEACDLGHLGEPIGLGNPRLLIMVSHIKPCNNIITCLLKSLCSILISELGEARQVSLLRSCNNSSNAEMRFFCELK